MENLNIDSIGYAITILFVPFFILLLLSYRIKNFFLDRTLFFYLLITNIVYWYWRFNYTLEPFSWDTAYSWIFFISETIVIYLFCFTGFVLSTLNKKDEQPFVDENACLGDEKILPVVDILIPTYNEHAELLEKTIICAKNIDYSKYQIWMLDNGNRSEIKELCAQYGINYLERVDYVNSKSGSLNNALKHTKELTRSEYILVIDSDYLCHKNIIKRFLLPFYQSSKKIGLVQAPQYFYNADPLQNSFKAKEYLSDEQRVFFDVMSPAMNKLDIATCCGSPFLVKREALELVGGFPLNTLTEDINLTYLLYHHDYVVFYIKEALAYGLTAENIDQYISQRKRWAIGHVQQFFTKEGPFSFKRQTLLQRLFFLAGITAWFSYLFRIIYLLAPLLNLFFSIDVIYISESTWVPFLPVYVLTNFSFLYIKSKKTYIPIITDAIHFAIAIPLFAAIFKSLRKVKKLRVDVTEKEPLLGKATLNYHVAMPLLVFLVMYIAGIFYVILTCYSSECLPDHYSGISWAIINLIFILFSLVIAIDRGHEKDLWLTDFPVTLIKENNEELELKVVGLSLDHCRLHVNHNPFYVGEKVKLKLDTTLILFGQITYSRDQKVELKFLDPYQDRLKIINFAFSEGRIVITAYSRPLRALKKLFF